MLERARPALVRTQVGDRYVVEQMRADGYNLGGEQSGHIVLTDHATTGDGLMAALQVLAALVESGKPASEVCRAVHARAANSQERARRRRHRRSNAAGRGRDRRGASSGSGRAGACWCASRAPSR